MSTISAGTTTTTALVQTGDTTGSLVLATGSGATTALTIDSSQNITTANKFASASMPTGSVLQVVSATSSSGTSTSSGTFIDTGFSATITPKFSTSKVLILFSGFNMVQNGNQAPVITFYRNTTSLNTIGMSQVYNQAALNVSTGPAAAVYLDSPATTSATAYKLYFCNLNNNGTVQLNSSGGLLSIVLMEIAA